jgi:hypothetical protein
MFDECIHAAFDTETVLDLNNGKMEQTFGTHSYCHSPLPSA